MHEFVQSTSFKGIHRVTVSGKPFSNMVGEPLDYSKNDKNKNNINNYNENSDNNKLNDLQTIVIII